MTTEGMARLAASGIEADLALLLARHARSVRLARGEWLFREGDECDSFVVVISGSLRIQKMSDHGHELALSRVESGQECNLASICLLGGRRYPAEAVAEQESELLLVSRSDFFRLLEQQPGFRSLIYKNIEHGMTELLGLVQEIAFEQMDHRLAAALLKRSHMESVVKATHMELALELGTAREVISRLLKGFERDGWIRLRRGQIEIVDRGALARR